MKQVLLNKGQAQLEEVPIPALQKGTLLIDVDHSCISMGTELNGLRTSALPLWKRALEQPHNVKKVWKMVMSNGLSSTINFVQGRVGNAAPTGYSAAGVVRAVAEDIDDIVPGDRVACGGAQCAFHAEVIRVPRNLAVVIPENVDFAQASTATVGAIAMQGVRRANPTLGETFVVIGLGVVGQLIAQILQSNGCRVIGIDLDRKRLELAKSLGADIVIHPDDGSDLEQIARLTDGLGADGAIIAASSPSHGVVSTAFKVCRKKGRVVLVGNVGLNLDHGDFYEKELDFFVSTSYGPGRYDRVYEEKGLDYPASYVRWTENRNMAQYLYLVSAGKVKVAPLVSSIYPVDQAQSAYQILNAGGVHPPLLLLSYARQKTTPDQTRTIRVSASAPIHSGKIGISVIGAGEFVKNFHLPNIRALSNRFVLKTVVTRSGHTALAIAKQFNAQNASTDIHEVLNDSGVHAVLIATPNHIHASLSLEALKAGKHVLVEKPLALKADDLDAIEAFYSGNAKEGAAPVLLTGFNRRFSPYARTIRNLIEGRSNPMMINYRMNAGYIPATHWVQGEQGGGRNQAEACHIYDLFTYLTGSKIVQLGAYAIDPKTSYYGRNENFVATLKFEDGSVATLTYTALGSTDYPKEQMEVYVDGKVLALDDYRQLKVAGANAGGINAKVVHKGHKEELEAFASVISEGGKWPIPLWQQMQATRIAMRVEELLVQGK